MTQRNTNKTDSPQGLKINRVFTKEGTSPFNQFEYELRQSVIKDPNGKIVFEVSDVEVPKGWSQVATDILAQKYFRKTGVPQKDGTTGSEKSAKEVANRLANCWRKWGEENNYFDTKHDADIFYDEMVYCILSQTAAPNSPQWFNTGLHSSYGITGKPQGHYYVDEKTGKLRKSTSAYERPQPHACFILSVDDDLVNGGGIMDLWVREARIFKYGSGVGTNFSNLRGKNESLSGGGKSSGLMSFLKIGDRAAGAIKSGGTTRRAAKMVTIDMDHPEVQEFINWKVEEENKVGALIKAGYPSDYEGTAYQTVSGQNSNNSVRVPNSFFEALKADRPWTLTSRTDGSAVEEVSAKKLWTDITHAAWKCADPGVQFDTTINEWHTCPEGGKIRASNPCSEYMFLDNTACNLASVNLRKFWNEKEQKFNVEEFEHACRLWTIVLEISVLMAQFPSKEIAQLSYEYRTLGLGYTNIGSLLMCAGIPYDSDKGRAIAASITAILTGTAYKTSAEMAGVKGPFKQYNKNKKHMMRVIRNHRYAANNTPDSYEELEVKPPGIQPQHCPDYLLKAAGNVWDEVLQLGEANGFRNAQVSVLAPTGTISLLMDCDTTGIEPDFSLIKFKKLSGGGYFKIINQSVPVALDRLGYTKEQIKDILEYMIGKPRLDTSPHINHESLRELGFDKGTLSKLDEASKNAMTIQNMFSPFTMGEAIFQQLNINPETYTKKGFNLLSSLGFTKNQINEANTYLCGTLTIEGAPHIKEEHLPVFDCANKCGSIGKRYLHSSSHIKMMAAAQPFITGAISKTVNLPHEATEKEIKDCYEMSWELGLKACAVYRDGCKHSQPLTSKKEEDDTADTYPGTNGRAKGIQLTDITPEQVLEAAQKIMSESTDTSFKRELSRIVERKKLPNKRNGFTQKAKIGGQTVFIRTGEYADHTLGEIFIDMHKEGASFRSLLNCFAIAVSIGLQYGVPIEEFVSKFIYTRFEPSGMVEHDYIKSTTSVVDYIFRLLAWEYLGREDLLHVKPELEKQEVEESDLENIAQFDHDTTIEERTSHQQTNVKVSTQTDAKEEHMEGLMGDAPTCDICGHITIRSGTCYHCLNCGNSLGCS